MFPISWKRKQNVPIYIWSLEVDMVAHVLSKYNHRMCNFIWIEPLLRDHLCYNGSFSCQNGDLLIQLDCISYTSCNQVRTNYTVKKSLIPDYMCIILSTRKKNVATLGHTILIPSQPVFVLSPEWCVLSGEAANINYIILGFEQKKSESI
jgi:hypothetical protein